MHPALPPALPHPSTLPTLPSPNSPLPLQQTPPLPSSAPFFPPSLPGARLPRTTCTDLCLKHLSGCAHACATRCYAGPCPPCFIPLVRPCRCRATTRNVPCSAVGGARKREKAKRRHLEGREDWSRRPSPTWCTEKEKRKASRRQKGEAGSDGSDDRERKREEKGWSLTVQLASRHRNRPHAAATLPPSLAGEWRTLQPSHAPSSSHTYI